MISEKDAREWFTRRFGRNPDHDRLYFEEWYTRLNSENPIGYMDYESRQIYEDMFT